tara:strand:+ start:175 stop:789 length:615 start_codon:yes stop_codon:yes gene_type:complete
MLPYNQRYCVWDFETEGLNQRYSKPWQLAWTIFEGERKVETQNRFINIPNLQLSDVVKRITKFDKAKYDRLKEPAIDVYKAFEKEINDPRNVFVGQNLINYDIFILASMQKDLGFKLNNAYMDRIIDTRPLGVAFQEKLEKPKGNFLSWQYKIINDRSLKSKASQKFLLNLLQIPFDENKLHDADYDSLMCFEIFKNLKKALKL